MRRGAVWIIRAPAGRDKRKNRRGGACWRLPGGSRRKASLVGPEWFLGFLVHVLLLVVVRFFLLGLFFLPGRVLLFLLLLLDGAQGDSEAVKLPAHHGGDQGRLHERPDVVGR